MTEFHIADHHFYHKNICLYEDRPFSSIEEMNTFMIEAWNKVVGNGDKIWVHGDFAFTNKELTSNILRQLKGRTKVLICGNHDRGRSISWWRDAGFDEVYRHVLIIKDYFILSHEPVYLNKHMPYVNIHGHIHSKQMDLPTYYNVGVELNNYTPVAFDTILDKYKDMTDEKVTEEDPDEKV